MLQGSLKSLRHGNRERLLALLRDYGGMRRAELARRAGVSRTTVSTIVADLLSEGLVVEAGTVADRSSSGRRGGGLLTLNPKAGAVLGVDISLTAVHAVVADLGHEVRASGSVPLGDTLAWGARLDAAACLAKELLDQVEVELGGVVGAGLGVPGPVHHETGVVAASSNSLGWEGVPAGEEFSRRLGVPVALDNTSHLGSLAEVMWGAGRGCRDIIYLKLSAGIGAGFMLDGRIFRGAVGAAGELGHISVDEAGPACRCGNRGCLEVYASASAVTSALQEAYGVLTVDEVINFARSGHRACQRVLADAGLTLGRALASVGNLLNPELVIVGGELAGAGDLLLDPLRSALDRHALKIIADNLRVVPGQLGAEAGALGGVALVLREAERLARATT